MQDKNSLNGTITGLIRGYTYQPTVVVLSQYNYGTSSDFRKVEFFYLTEGGMGTKFVTPPRPSEISQNWIHLCPPIVHAYFWYVTIRCVISPTLVRGVI